MNETKFKLGLHETSTMGQSVVFNLYMLIRAFIWIIVWWTILLLLLVSQRIPGSQILQTERFFPGYIFGLAILLLIPFYFFIRRIPRYEHYWLRFDKDRLRIFKDVNTSDEWLAVDYKDIQSAHHFSKYAWRDNLLGRDNGIEWLFLRIKVDGIWTYTYSLDLGPKTKKDMAEALAALKKNCPTIEVHNDERSLRTVLISR